MQEFITQESLEKSVSASLAESDIACKVVVVEESGSTNSDCLNFLKTNTIDVPFALLALEQTAGRGRLGRAWFGARGASLFLSVCVEVPKIAEIMESFTVRAGLRVCEQLERLTGAELFIKWPNDIYTRDGKKLAGMLAELNLSADKAIVVFGIGINCDFSSISEDSIPEEIRGIYADLHSVAKKDFSLDDVCVAATKGVVIASKDNLNALEQFPTRDWLNGRQITASVGNEIFDGVACGIDARGRLAVRLADASIKYLHSGEATLKKKYIISRA